MGALVSSLSQPWLSTLFGVIGLVAAIFFYLRARRFPRLAYQHNEVTLLGGSEAAFPSEVEIRFSGTPVSGVTLSRFVLWNAGKTTLRGSDIVGSDPLRVDLGGTGAILKVTVAKVHREVNASRVSLRGPDATAADISFDYLDPGDGIAFEVLHSGGRKDLSIKGTMRGLPEGARNLGQIGPLTFRSLRSTVLPLVAIGTFFVVAASLAPGLHLSSASGPVDWTLMAMGVLTMVSVALAFALVWRERRRYPAALEVCPLGGEGEHDEGKTKQTAAQRSMRREVQRP